MLIFLLISFKTITAVHQDIIIDTYISVYIALRIWNLSLSLLKRRCKIQPFSLFIIYYFVCMFYFIIYYLRCIQCTHNLFQLMLQHSTLLQVSNPQQKTLFHPLLICVCMFVSIILQPQKLGLAGRKFKKGPFADLD